MEMSHNFVWRIAAKFVTVVHSIFAFWSLLVFWVLFLRAVTLESACGIQKPQTARTGGDLFQDLGLMINQMANWAVILLYGAVVPVELYSAKVLYKATKQETHVIQAFVLLLTWLRAQLCCIVLVGVFHLACGRFWIWIVETYVRMAAIYVVSKYNEELKQAIEATGIDVQDSSRNTSKISAEKAEWYYQKTEHQNVFDV